LRIDGVAKACMHGQGDGAALAFEGSLAKAVKKPVRKY